MKKEMFHVIRQTLRSAYLSMMGTFAKPAVGIHIISGHRIEDELEPETFKKLLSNLYRRLTVKREAYYDVRLLSAIIGLFFGIAIMCLLQINRGLDNEENKIDN